MPLWRFINCQFAKQLGKRNNTSILCQCLQASQVYSSLLQSGDKFLEKWKKIILNIQQRLLEYYKTQGYIYMPAVTRHGGMSLTPALRRKRQRQEDLHVRG